MKIHQVSDKNYKHRHFVDYEKSWQKASDCKTLNDIEERRLILSKKKLCFNCTGAKYRASEFLSNRSYEKCKGKRCPTICDKTTNTLLTNSSYFVTYPVALVEIVGVKHRVLIDTGAGASYASSTLISHSNKKTIRTETKKIET